MGGGGVGRHVVDTHIPHQTSGGFEYSQCIALTHQVPANPTKHAPSLCPEVADKKPCTTIKFRGDGREQVYYQRPREEPDLQFSLWQHHRVNKVERRPPSPCFQPCRGLRALCNCLAMAKIWFDNAKEGKKAAHITTTMGFCHTYLDPHLSPNPPTPTTPCLSLHKHRLNSPIKTCDAGNEYALCSILTVIYQVCSVLYPPTLLSMR
ncbi:unnamed protein product [Discosporangium mesarthrocarpum]